MALQANKFFNYGVASAMYSENFNINGKLKIYTGTVPQIGDFTSWQTYGPTRASDLLVTLNQAEIFRESTQQTDAVFFNENHPIPSVAVVNGTATWAALINYTENAAIVGKVSESGGDGLFILNSVNLTTTDPVVVIGFRMQW